MGKLKNSAQIPLCLSQIPHGLAWDKIQLCVVRGQKVEPQYNYLYMLSCVSYMNNCGIIYDPVFRMKVS
jgi:hypothetical protein